MFERKSACLIKPQPALPQTVELNEATIEQQANLVAANSTPVPILKESNPNPTLAAARKNYLFEQVKILQEEAIPLRQIARELGISRQTVRKYTQATQVPVYIRRAPTFSILDVYKPYLAARFGEGVTKGTQLFQEIRERGYTGSWALVGGYLAQFRQEFELANPQWRLKLSLPPQIGRPPGSGKILARARLGKPQPMLSAREAVWVMLKAPDSLSEKQQGWLKHLINFDKELETAYQLSQAFVMMVRHRQGDKLEEWLNQVTEKVAAAQLVEFGSFARGIRQDFRAVKNGLSLPYSQGQVEGQVNRLKTLKRNMFGRAKFDLLKARLLHQPSG
jgi:transposase